MVSNHKLTKINLNFNKISLLSCLFSARLRDGIIFGKMSKSCIRYLTLGLQNQIIHAS